MPMFNQSPVSGVADIMARIGRQQLSAVGFGNSITNQYPNYINYMSGSGSAAIFQTTNAGVSGNTTSQMLARLDSVIAAMRPSETVVIVMECTNDANPGNSISRATHVLNMREILRKIIYAGKLPIVILPPPKSTDTKKVEDLRLCDYLVAREYGVPCYDPWGVIVDPATGGMVAGKTLDGTHPNPSGASDAGLELADQLSRGRPAALMLNRANNNQSGLWPSNCWLLTDTNADGLPDGWSKGGVTTSLSASAAPAKGNALQLTVTAAAGYAIGPAAAVAEGDEIVFTGYYEVVSIGNSGLSAAITLRTNSGFQNYAISQQGISPMAVFYYRYVVPAGVTTLSPQINVNAGSAGIATVRVASLQAYNITQALL